MYINFFFLAMLLPKKETYFKIQLVNSATAAGSTLACFFCYSVRLDSLKLRLRLWQAVFLFFFFFSCVLEECGNCCSLNSNRKYWLFHRKQCIYALFTDQQILLFNNFSLKIDPMTLFTHLKIILLQCFQFSVFNFSKISSIQTDR